METKNKLKYVEYIVNSKTMKNISAVGIEGRRGGMKCEKLCKKCMVPHVTLRSDTDL